MATLSLVDDVSKEDAKEDAEEDGEEDAKEDAEEDAKEDAEEDAEEDAKTDRVKHALAELDFLLNESLDEYKSLVEQMRKKIREIERRRFVCACGVLIQMKKLHAGGKCTKCLRAMERLAMVRGGE